MNTATQTKRGSYRPSGRIWRRVSVQAVETADDIARKKLPQQAMQMAMGDVALIPLHIQTNIWVTRAGLTYVPTVGEELRLVDVRPAK